MRMLDFREDPRLVAEAAALLAAEWPDSYADCADKELTRICDPERLLVGAVGDSSDDGFDGHLLGFTGAIPQYRHGWELHPLIVHPGARGRGIGRRLVAALEDGLRARGCFLVYLGSDDERGATTLGDTDLWDDPLGALSKAVSTNGHAIGFYRHVGFVPLGVFPDANGFGKPDIWLGKRLRAGLRIEPASPANTADLGYVHALSWQAAYAGLIDADYLAELTPERRTARFAEYPADVLGTMHLGFLGEKAVGLVMFGDCRDADLPGAGEVMGLYLLPEAWGLGYGRQLMDFALHRLGARRVSLWVLAGNERAIRFYTRSGFAPDGVTRPITIGGRSYMELRMCMNPR